jgi:WD40 repeat protein
VALTPDARRAVTAGEDFTARVWDVLTGRCMAVLTGHSGWVVDAVVTQDGKRAVTASHDGTARCLHGPLAPNRLPCIRSCMQSSLPAWKHTAGLHMRMLSPSTAGALSWQGGFFSHVHGDNDSTVVSTA